MAAVVDTLPAPVGGINALDSIVAMAPTDAISLINFIPQAYGCLLRNGYQQHGSGYGADVQTLLPFYDQSAADKLYAFAGTSMFDASSTGAAGAAVLTGLTNSQWQFTHFANSAGTHAIGFNGIDNGIWINLSLGIQRLVLGDGVTNATIKNIDPKSVIDCTVHQRRLWMVKINSMQAYYLPTDQAFGIASLFDFGPIFKRGGFLQSLATWTVDDGTGPADRLLAISSEGEVAVYNGLDPSTVSTWSLQGVYYAGAPVMGHRFHCKVASDVKFVTNQGVISMNDMMTSNTVKIADSSIDSQKVQQPISMAAQTLGSLFGWQAYFCAPINQFWVNTPSVSNVGNTQFAENTINSAWCQYQGYDASHVVDFNRLPYFGRRDGTIWKAWYGNVDGAAVDGSGGVEVTGIAQQAYSFLGAPSTQKQVGMYRPTFLVNANCSYGSAVAYDFAFVTPPIISAGLSIGGSKWDIALWDAGFWSGSLYSQRQWSQAVGMGTAVSFCFTVRSKNEVLWVATDFTHNDSAGGVF